MLTQVYDKLVASISRYLMMDYGFAYCRDPSFPAGRHHLVPDGKAEVT